MASSKSIISEQEFRSNKSDLIKTVDGHYILVYPKRALLNNVLTEIRILPGIATVYQRDTIKKNGGRNYVPIEIGYITPSGYGGQEKFEDDMVVSIRKISDVVSLSRISKRQKK
tara:strand:- start:3799 stop:4140 length:342 start_codon:yes stop_codon:yes gene_type:complete